MRSARPTRPVVKGNKVSRTVLASVRILIASYFLATATGLVLNPASRTFLDGVLLENQAQLVATIYLFVTAFSVMVGFAVRPAALLLAVYVFWSGLLGFSQSNETAALSTFWRDMALLGALLLVAVTEPGGSTKFRLWAKPVAPRRIARARMKRIADRPARPQISQEQYARTAMVGLSFADVPEDDQMQWNALEDERDQAEAQENMFKDLWEEIERPAALA